MLKVFMERLPGCSDIQGFPVLEELGVDGVSVVVVEDADILVSACREDRELACLV